MPTARPHALVPHCVQILHDLHLTPVLQTYAILVFKKVEEKVFELVLVWQRQDCGGSGRVCGGCPGGYGRVLQCRRCGIVCIHQFFCKSRLLLMRRLWRKLGYIGQAVARCRGVVTSPGRPSVRPRQSQRRPARQKIQDTPSKERKCCVCRSCSGGQCRGCHILYEISFIIICSLIGLSYNWRIASRSCRSGAED